MPLEQNWNGSARAGDKARFLPSTTCQTHSIYRTRRVCDLLRIRGGVPVPEICYSAKQIRWAGWSQVVLVNAVHAAPSCLPTWPIFAPSAMSEDVQSLQARSVVSNVPSYR